MTARGGAPPRIIIGETPKRPITHTQTRMNDIVYGIIFMNYLAQVIRIPSEY